MNEPILWGVGGLLIGFIIEYLVDLFFWRQKIRGINSRNDQYESLLGDQKAEITYLRGQLATFEKSVDEYEAYSRKLDAELETARQDLAVLRVQHEEAEARAMQYQRDSVAMRRKLHTQVSAETPAANDESRIQLARYKKALHDAVSENKLLAKKLAEQELKANRPNGNGNAGINETYRKVDDLPQAEIINIEVEPDNLEQIAGIGPVYANKLRAAGVVTFADLARLRADRLTDIIQPNRWQLIEPDRWITEAAIYARSGGRKA